LLIYNFIKVYVAKITAFEEFLAVRKILYFFVFLAVGGATFFNIFSGYPLQVLAPTSLWAFHYYPAARQQYIFFHLLFAIDYVIEKLLTLE
jgi:hypothetical protein